MAPCRGTLGACDLGFGIQKAWDVWDRVCNGHEQRGHRRVRIAVKAGAASCGCLPACRKGYDKIALPSASGQALDSPRSTAVRFPTIPTCCCCCLCRYSSVQWSTIGVMLLGVNQLSPRSPGARIVVAGFAFTSLLLFCMYTAASSAAITIGVQRADVADVEDLQRLAVGIWEGDVDALSEFVLDDVYRLVWNTDADGEEMIQDLRLGRLDALILDDPFVQYQTSRHCDLFAVRPGAQGQGGAEADACVDALASAGLGNHDCF